VFIDARLRRGRIISNYSKSLAYSANCGSQRPIMKHCRDSTCRKNSPPAHSARPPLNAHLRTRGGHMRRVDTPLSDCRVYSWALLSVTDAK